jgi:effector-binding domain-containing protein/uncharacterized protein YndB with AHSA1/START domain
VKIFRNVLIALVAVCALAFGVAFFLPASAHVERSTTIAAPAHVVFAILNSYKRYNEWSPWYEYDPAARYTYSGPAEGVGARLAWASDKPEVGSGWQEITASEPPRRVVTHLDFGDQGSADASFRLEEKGGSTVVTWGFDTVFDSVVERYFGLVLDKLVGGDFEKGLARLKTLAEADTRKPADAQPVQAQPTLEEVGAFELVSIEGTTSLDPVAMSRSLGEAYGRIQSFLGAHGLKQSGATLAITRFYDESGWGFEAAIPYSGTADAKARANAAASNGIKVGKSYSGSALKAIHVGPYATLPETYQKLEDFAAEKGLDANGRPWEQYISDPRSTPAEELRTEVFIPVRVTPSAATAGRPGRMP